MTDTTTVTSSYDSQHDPMGHENGHHHPTVGTYLAVFVALMVLLIATVIAAEYEVHVDAEGRAAHTVSSFWNLVIAASIASVKAILIIMFFMHVRYSTPLIWLVAGAGFIFLAIMFSFGMTDYLTRPIAPPSESAHADPR
jgi:cytochrome c oxidase subunit IV